MTTVWGPAPESDDRPRPRRLLLARHGTTDWNARHLWQGHADVPLNDLGRAQARALAARLADEGVDALWTSDLSRARETAEIVGARLGLVPAVTPLLREIDVGAWEGLPGREIEAREPEVFAALARGEDLPRGGHGETVAAFQARVAQGFEEACRTAVGGTLLLVAHGGVNKVLVAHLLGLPRTNVGRLTSGRNASVSEVVFGAAGPQLVLLNDARHADGVRGPDSVDSA